jgi:hypothetical protein
MQITAKTQRTPSMKTNLLNGIGQKYVLARFAPWRLNKKSPLGG